MVVGGGRKAERKARFLLECGAKVTVISPKLTPALLELSNYSRLIHAAREYRSGDLKGVFLVLAVSNPEVNTKVAREANRRGILINVEDNPGQSSFILPSVIRRGELIITISTGESSPALTDKVKRELQERYGPEYRDYVNLLADAEKKIKEKYSDPEQCHQAFLRIMDSDVLELLSKGRRDLAEGRIKQCI